MPLWILSRKPNVVACKDIVVEKYLIHDCPL
jgi:hypothetical protein